MNIDLSSKPKFLPSYHVVPLTTNEILIKNEERMMILGGEGASKLAFKLLPLLDGVSTIDEIIKRSGLGREFVLSSLNKLNRFKLFEDGNVRSPPDFSIEEIRLYEDQLNLFSHFDLNKYEVQKRLKQSTVGIVGLGCIGFRLCELLGFSGIGNIVGMDSSLVEGSEVTREELEKNTRVPRAKINEKHENQNQYIKFQYKSFDYSSAKDMLPILEGLDMVVLSQDKFDTKIYELVNEACIRLGINWTSCGLSGLKGFVGPAISPRQTACYKCFELRTNSNLEFYRESLAFQEYVNVKQTYCKFGKLTMFSEIISSITAIEIVKILSNFMKPTTFGRQMIVDFSTLKTEFHDILKLPRCPVCGAPSKNIPTIRPWLQ